MGEFNNNIYYRVLEFIKDNKLASENDKILLALSAGKDSMTLLDVFLHLRENLSVDIAIFHLNHMLRGKESDEDEEFLLNIASRSNIRLFRYKYNFNNKKKGLSLEEYARTKRYELLEKVCEEHNFQKIATAHNRDDNIETILMRIFNGTGINGLSGIDIKRNKLIRPLLFLSAKEIYDHLKTHNLKWREDSSNKDNKYLRNFVRNSLLPEIITRFPNTGKALLSLSKASKEYTSLLKELLTEKEGKLYIYENSSLIIDLERFISDKRLFKLILLDSLSNIFKHFVNSRMLEEIYKKAKIEKTHLLLYENKKLLIRKTLKNNKKVIVISENIGYKYNRIEWQYRLDLKSGNNNTAFIKEINSEICFNIVDYKFFLKHKNSGQMVFVSLKNPCQNVIIRNRRNGDRIKLEFGHKKIKDLLIDQKINNTIKESVPLLIINHDIAAFMPFLITDLPYRVSVDYHIISTSDKILAVYKNDIL